MSEADLRDKLDKYGQQHLLRFAGELSADERANLIGQISALDFEQIRREFAQAEKPAAKVDSAAVQPIEVLDLPHAEHEQLAWRKAAKVGEEALAAGRTAVLLVAGGQGSRLGFEHPKGMFPLGPVRGTSLFQIFAEKIRARAKKAGRRIPWYIMTSPTNRAETEAYFEEKAYFGLNRDDVRFFVQGTMPAVDRETGKVLLASKGELFLSPNGHGGTLLALKKERILADLASRGIDLVYYFQVDNPFVEVLEPAFLGFHLQKGSEFSAKVVRKTDPKEKVGLVVRYQGKPTVIEYSDLPAELGSLRSPDGGLQYWPGSIAIHVFGVSFLERVANAGLPFHVAHKAVPYVAENGSVASPKEPNAVKFETFIFDSLPHAKATCIVETSREGEFAPVKNATGADSPDSVRAAMVKRAGDWLRRAGIPFVQNADGTPAPAVEISPLAGLDADDFADRGWPRKEVNKPTYYTQEE
jgi:UDP-N-acetylglucosamine/UDP-N-acetylgalactosamine diphosphorylase